MDYLEAFRDHSLGQPKLTISLSLFLAAGLVWFLRKLNRWRAIASIKREHNCQEPTIDPYKDALGLDLVALRDQAKRDGRMLRLYDTHFLELGQTFEDHCQGQVTINTRDPVNVKYIFTSPSIGRPDATPGVAWPFMGQSVMLDNPHHKTVRTLLKPAFSRSENSSYQIKPFVEDFLRLLPPAGQVFDIQPLLNRLFLDVASAFVFGQPIGAMVPNKSTSSDDVTGDEFLAAFKTAGKWIGIRRSAGRLAWRYNWNKEYLIACATVHKFIDKQVKRALEAGSADSKQGRTVIIDELAQHIRDPIALRYQTLGVFLPAMDALSSKTANILFELARHPHIWHRLRKLALSAQEPLSFDELRSPKFQDVQNVINESIRRLGLARIWRTAIRDTCIPRGGGPTQDQPVFVAKGTKLACNVWSMNHDASFWGADVEEFKPERWEHKKPGEYEYVPFSGGPRICPAANQSILHMSYVLVKLLQRYESIENHDPVYEYVEKWTMGHESRNGVKIAFVE